MIGFQNKRIGFESSYCQQHCQQHSSLWEWGNHMENSKRNVKKLDIYAVAVAPFMRRVKKNNSKSTQ